jgi:5,6-dimethylbenzimidazole synthase
MHAPPDSATASRFDHLTDLVRWRRDVRHFQTTPVSDVLLERIFRLADLAPSVGLSQPWRVINVRDPTIRLAARENFEAANQQALSQLDGDSAQQYARLKLAGFDQAPVQLAVYCDVDPSQGRGLGPCQHAGNAGVFERVHDPHADVGGAR